jgi:hypothetical protein
MRQSLEQLRAWLPEAALPLQQLDVFGGPIHCPPSPTAAAFFTRDWLS